MRRSRRACGEYRPSHAEDCAVEIDVLPTSQFLMKAGPDFEQGAHSAPDLRCSGGWSGDARKKFKQGSFACAIPANDPQDIPASQFEGDSLSAQKAASGEVRCLKGSVESGRSYPSAYGKVLPSRRCGIAYPIAKRKVLSSSYRSDNVGEGLFGSAEINKSCEEQYGRNDCRNDQDQARGFSAEQAPPESFDNSNHWIDAVEASPRLAQDATCIDDRRRKHPKLRQEGRT